MKMKNIIWLLIIGGLIYWFWKMNKDKQQAVATADAVVNQRTSVARFTSF